MNRTINLLSVNWLAANLAVSLVSKQALHSRISSALVLASDFTDMAGCARSN